MTKIMPCTCSHEEQDKLYGKGRRVFNRMNPSSNIKEWRCTVCGKEIKTE